MRRRRRQLSKTARHGPGAVRGVWQRSAGRADNARESNAPEYAPSWGAHCERWENAEMLHYAVVFFIIAIIAAVLGFGGIAAGAGGIAKVFFFGFLVLALITFLRRA